MDSKTTDLAAAREAMIDSQLRPSGVNAPFALARMAATPREDFVPAALRSFAYMDRALDLGDGQYLPSPVFHGRLLQEARPGLDDRVLVIDNGSHYLAELVRPMVARLDRVDSLDAAAGKLGEGQYSLILIDGAIEQLPDRLKDRIEEGGRIVTGLLDNGVTRLAIGRKIAGIVALQPVADMGIPVLLAFLRPRQWSFAS